MTPLYFVVKGAFSEERKLKTATCLAQVCGENIVAIDASQVDHPLFSDAHKRMIARNGVKIVPLFNKDGLPGSVITSVRCCARCAKDHDDLRFYEFTNAPELHTHFANCPETGEPILMRIEQDGKQ